MPDGPHAQIHRVVAELGVFRELVAVFDAAVGIGACLQVFNDLGASGIADGEGEVFAGEGGNIIEVVACLADPELAVDFLRWLIDRSVGDAE